MDALERARRAEFVRSQMDRYSGKKKEQGDRVFVCCPFHSENTPSGALRTAGEYAGFFHCFGCGKKAKWDELAPKLGLEPFHRGPPREEQSMDLFMERALAQLSEDKPYGNDKFKFWPLPKGKRWRGIPTDLLIELGGRMCLKWSAEFKRWGSTKHIYMPVMINGEQRGYFRARLKKDPEYPSYVAASASTKPAWSVTHGLWPYDYAVSMMNDLGLTSMTLVEGQRDALRLLLNGIPAVCIMGTQSWSDNKSKLLELAGVRTIVLMMDGDPAGIDATERLEDEVRPLFEVKTVRLWAIKGSPYLKVRKAASIKDELKRLGLELWDPGACPQWIIDTIKRKYFT